MKIVATTRILDEADIVEAFVRHTATYASHHVFIDNGSRDGTIDILRSLNGEGYGISVLQNRAVSFNEMHFNTSLFNQAVRVHGADWVLCLDADEFIDDRAMSGDLAEVLSRLDAANEACLAVPMVNYYRSDSDDVEERIVPLRMRRRDEPIAACKCFFSKRLARPEFRIAAGGHDGFLASRRIDRKIEPGLLLAHYPDRAPYQIAAKWVKGWCKVLAAGPEEVANGQNRHYRAPFEMLRDAPERLSPSFFVPEANLHRTADPIDYRGSVLRYTGSSDDRLRATRMIVGYFEDLAIRYGNLVEGSPEARRIARGADARLDVVIGDEDGPVADVNLMQFHTGVVPRRVDGMGDRPSSLLRRIRSRAAVAFHELGRWAAPRDVSVALARLDSGGMAWRDFRDAATALSQEGLAEEADAVLSRAVAAFPDDGDMLVLHALSAHEAGRYIVAALRWAEAARVRPDDPFCAAGLAANLRGSGQGERASVVIEAARVRFPDNIDVKTEAARVAQACRDYDLAANLWKSALGNRTGHPDWWVSYLQCLEHLGRKADVDTARADALRAFPDHAVLRDRAHRLAHAEPAEE